MSKKKDLRQVRAEFEAHSMFPAERCNVHGDYWSHGANAAWSWYFRCAVDNGVLTGEDAKYENRNK
jgi:hypothetical protein